MFDGVPADQFHQFVASSRASLPLPLSFPLHGSSSSSSPSPSFTSFDPYPSHGHQALQLPHLLHAHQLQHQSSATAKDDQEDKDETSCLFSPNLDVQRERSMSHLIQPWSNDEVLALLRIRSSMENWFSDFTWEHVSRKLAEFGYKRSAEKCKEKFEEESRHFNTSISYNKSYRFLSELEQLCHGDHHQSLDHQLPAGKSQNSETTAPKDHQEELGKMGRSLELQGSRNETNPSKEGEIGDDDEKAKHSKSKKRKRREKFEMLKCFCEDITKKMMAQQEELHNRLMEDMLRRDEEKIAREEAWKRQEMDRIEKEIQMRAEEQAIAGQRQATIIEFLKKFTSIKVPNYNSNLPTSSSSLIQPPYSQNPNLSCPLSNSNNHGNIQTVQNESEAEAEAATSSTHHVAVAHAQQNSPSTDCLTLPPTQNPNSPDAFAVLPTTPFSSLVSTKPKPITMPKPHQSPNPSTRGREDIGKRWPRDEVLALINLRCNLCSSNTSSGEDKESGGGNKNSNSSNSTIPLWERISQGMLELGYKRSAKRCKEKWENINKYFRKTKDGNKKRPMDSRTCPYFHLLSCLYSQGKLVAPVAEDSASTPAPVSASQQRPTSPENLPGPATRDAMHAATTTTITY